MEPVKDINRMFPNCETCGNTLAQCCCPAARNEFDALKEYVTLREQLCELELHEDDCKCGEFYTCDLCREAADKSHAMKVLMELWGDNWAVRLDSQRAAPSLAESAKSTGQGRRKHNPDHSGVFGDGTKRVKQHPTLAQLDKEITD